MRDIVLSRVYPHPRARVWTCLTDADLLAAWLMPNDFRPEAGHAFTFRTTPAPGFDGIVRARVEEIVPPERLVIGWAGGGLDTRVTFVLTEVEEGTRLDFRQSGFRGLRAIIPRIALGSGWRGLLARKLPDVLSRMEG
jgi:uncharacterized protein YndB with AHSA1/START domain